MLGMSPRGGPSSVRSVEFQGSGPGLLNARPGIQGGSRRLARAPKKTGWRPTKEDAPWRTPWHADPRESLDASSLARWKGNGERGREGSAARF